MFVYDDMTERIIGCGITVHKALGPGLIEATYESALCIELAVNEISYERQLVVPIEYRGRPVGEYRPDLVIEHRVVVEIKSVERLVGLHRAPKC